MGMRTDLELAEKSIERLQEKINELHDKNLELREELNHYCVAVSAVKWLWDQSVKQPEFQL